MKGFFRRKTSRQLTAWLLVLMMTFNSTGLSFAAEGKTGTDTETAISAEQEEVTTGTVSGDIIVIEDDDESIYDRAFELYCESVNIDADGEKIDSEDIWEKGEANDFFVEYDEPSYSSDYKSADVRVTLTPKDETVKITGVRKMGDFGEDTIATPADAVKLATGSDTVTEVSYEFTVTKNNPVFIVYYTKADSEEADASVLPYVWVIQDTEVTDIAADTIINAAPVTVDIVELYKAYASYKDGSSEQALTDLVASDVKDSEGNEVTDLTMDVTALDDYFTDHVLSSSVKEDLVSKGYTVDIAGLISYYEDTIKEAVTDGFEAYYADYLENGDASEYASMFADMSDEEVEKAIEEYKDSIYAAAFEDFMGEKTSVDLNAVTRTINIASVKKSNVMPLASASLTATIMDDNGSQSFAPTGNATISYAGTTSNIYNITITPTNMTTDGSVTTKQLVITLPEGMRWVDDASTTTSVTDKLTSDGVVAGPPTFVGGTTKLGDGTRTYTFTTGAQTVSVPITVAMDEKIWSDVLEGTVIVSADYTEDGTSLGKAKLTAADVTNYDTVVQDGSTAATNSVKTDEVFFYYGKPGYINMTTLFGISGISAVSRLIKSATFKYHVDDPDVILGFDTSFGSSGWTVDDSAAASGDYVFTFAASPTNYAAYLRPYFTVLFDSGKKAWAPGDSAIVTLEEAKVTFYDPNNAAGMTVDSDYDKKDMKFVVAQSGENVYVGYSSETLTGTQTATSTDISRTSYLTEGIFGYLGDYTVGNRGASDSADKTVNLTFDSTDVGVRALFLALAEGNTINQVTITTTTNPTPHTVAVLLTGTQFGSSILVPAALGLADGEYLTSLSADIGSIPGATSMNSDVTYRACMIYGERLTGNSPVNVMTAEVKDTVGTTTTGISTSKTTFSNSARVRFLNVAANKTEAAGYTFHGSFDISQYRTSNVSSYSIDSPLIYLLAPAEDENGNFLPYTNIKITSNDGEDITADCQITSANTADGILYTIDTSNVPDHKAAISSLKNPGATGLAHYRTVTVEWDMQTTQLTPAKTINYKDIIHVGSTVVDCLTSLAGSTADPSFTVSPFVSARPEDSITNYMKITEVKSLVVNTSAKHKNGSEWETWLEGQEPIAIGFGNNTFFQMKTSITNNSGSTVPGPSKVYIPIPKVGDNWGDLMYNGKDFDFSVSLKEPVTHDTSGDAGATFTVYYGTNIDPNKSASDIDLDGSGSWSTTAPTSQADWDKINCIKIVADNISAANADYDFIMNATTTQGQTLSDGKIDTFRTLYYQDVSTLDENGDDLFYQGLYTGGYIQLETALGEITGKVFIDANNNGKLDTGETLPSDVKFKIDVYKSDSDTLVQTVYTTAVAPTGTTGGAKADAATGMFNVFDLVQGEDAYYIKVSPEATNYNTYSFTAVGTASKMDSWNTDNQITGTTVAAGGTSTKVTSKQAATGANTIATYNIGITTTKNKITFDSNMTGVNVTWGTITPAKTVSDTKDVYITLTAPSDPAKTGYTFKGWAEKADAVAADVVTLPATFSGTKSTDKTYYGVWETNKYDLIYDANGGTGAPATEKHTIGESVTFSTTKPTHADDSGKKVVFIGWTSAKDTKIYAKNDTAPTTISEINPFPASDQTVYAVWGYDENNDGKPDVSQDKFDLTYDGNAISGTVSGLPTTNPVTGIIEGTDVTLTTTKPTHTQETVGGAAVDVLFVGWTAKANTKIYAAGDTKPTLITKTGAMNAAKTVYAAWSYDKDGDGKPDVDEKAYELTYDGNAISGTVSGLPTTNPVTGVVEGQDITLTTTKPTHTQETVGGAAVDVLFVGWTAKANTKIYAASDTKPTLITKTGAMNADKTVYAAWSYDENGNGDPDIGEGSHKVTFDGNGSNEDAALSALTLNLVKDVVIKTAAGFPADPTKDGYEFKGWTSSVSSKIIKADEKMPDSDVKLTAAWEKTGGNPPQGDTDSIGIAAEDFFLTSAQAEALIGLSGAAQLASAVTYGNARAWLVSDPETAVAVSKADVSAVKTASGDYNVVYTAEETIGGQKKTVTKTVVAKVRDSIGNNGNIAASDFTYGIYTDENRTAKNPDITEDMAKDLAMTAVMGQDANGKDLDLAKAKPDAAELAAVNAAKNAGQTGSFPLTFYAYAEDGSTVVDQVTIQVTLSTTAGNTPGKGSVYGNDFMYALKDENGNPTPVLTENDIKNYASVHGKDKDGNKLTAADIDLDDADVKAITDAQSAGQTGRFPVKATNADGAETTFYVTLKTSGTIPQPGKGQIGADDFDYGIKDENGNTTPDITADMAKDFASAVGMDKDGKPLDASDITVDQTQLDAINTAKNNGQTGSFPLTFTDPEGNKAVVNVTLKNNGTNTTDPTSGNPVITANDFDIKVADDPEGMTDDDLIKKAEADAYVIKDASRNGLTVTVKDRTNLVNSAGVYEVTFTTTDPATGKSADVTIKVTVAEFKISVDMNGINQDPPIKKEVSGGFALYNNASEFTFQMKALTSGAPMPDGSAGDVKTMTRMGAGGVEFGFMDYTDADAGQTYVYELSEVAGNRTYTYDTNKYTMSVHIDYNADRTGLTKEVKYFDKDGNEMTGATGVTFTNVFKSGSGNHSGGSTGGGSSSGGSTGGGSSTGGPGSTTPSTPPAVPVQPTEPGAAGNGDGGSSETPLPTTGMLGANGTALSGLDKNGMPKTGENRKTTGMMALLAGMFMFAAAGIGLTDKKRKQK